MRNAPPFTTPLPLKSGHAQTLFVATLFQPRPLPAEHTLKVIVPGTHAPVTLHCAYNRAGTEPAEACLILAHGLEGCAHAKYMVSTAQKALGMGLDVIRMNLRGAGGSAYDNATLYHAGLSQDLQAVCEYAHHMGYQKIVVGGFSLGAHMMLKMLAVWDVPTYIRGACAVSPPLELGLASESIMRRDNFIYERHFFRSMQKTYRERRRYWPEHTRMNDLSRAKNLRDFDDLITGPSFGYRDAQDYYQQNSVLQWWDQIATPTRIVYASDDPIVPLSSHIKAMQMGNPAVQWLMTSEGGHVGFYNQKKLALQDRDRLWGENRLLDFAESCLRLV